MGSVFVCYRRFDSEFVIPYLHDRFSAAFAAGSVLYDGDIPFGVDFRRHLDQMVTQCDALTAVIGDRWLDACDETGQRRLDLPNDFVRIELETALSRNVPVIPLVLKTRMPKEAELPVSLAPLAYRQALVVPSGQDLPQGVTRLVERIKDFFDQSEKGKVPKTRPYAFISYSTYDFQFVEREIATLLAKNNIYFWYWRPDIEFAPDDREVVQNAKESCTWFIVILSARAMQSPFTQREVDWAIRNCKPIITIKIDATDPGELHPSLPSSQLVNFSANPDRARKEIIQFFGANNIDKS